MRKTSVLRVLAVVPLIWLMAVPAAAQAKFMNNKVKGSYASVNGLKMYYEIYGPTKGTPLVLLHGGGSTIETTFGLILPLLAKNRRVMAFEQQGHGHTADIPNRHFSFEQSADDAAALLAFLKIDRADFFGFSNGGHIAVQVAIKHPGLVRKLIVASAPLKRDGFPPEFWEGFKDATLNNMPAELREAYLKTAPHPEQLETFFDKSVKRMVEFKDFRSEDIRAIKAETLIIFGDADVMRPEHGVGMFRLFPHARLAVIPGGHGTYLGAIEARKKGSELPNLTVSMVEEFLDTK